MKILLVQLARLGDIYLSYPTVNALKRSFPNAEIHLLVREKFSVATENLDSIDQVWAMDTRELLSPIFDSNRGVEGSLEEVNDFVEQLKAENYTNIINLSFSQFSSYLTHAVAQKTTQVFGYTRHEDGLFHIPDDTSAYFFAQVGVASANRLHVAELFAAIAGIELKLEDWSFRATEQYSPAIHGDYIVCHIGASQTHKMLNGFKWAQIIKRLVPKYRGKCILIGSPEEKHLAVQILASLKSESIVDLVGQTSLPQALDLVSKSQLLIGGDSVGLHMAALGNVRALNISFSTVNFWETGPYTEGSRVVKVSDADELLSDRLVDEIFGVLENKTVPYPGFYSRRGGMEAFVPSHQEPEDFTWNLVKSLYLGTDFPVPESQIFIDSVCRLQEICWLAIEQIEIMRHSGKTETAAKIIDRSDELMLKISEIEPSVEPIVTWFQTEKLRVPPASIERVIAKNYDLYKKLELILRIYGKENTNSDYLGEVQC